MPIPESDCPAALNSTRHISQPPFLPLIRKFAADCSPLHAGGGTISARIVPVVAPGREELGDSSVLQRNGLVKARSFVLPRLSSFSRRGSLRITRSTRDLHKIRITEANYDAVMDRFQLRRLTHIDKPAVREMAPRRAQTWEDSLKSLLDQARQPIQPDSSFALMHTLSVIAAFHLQLFFVPFTSIYHRHTSPAILQGHIAFEVVFLFDMALHLNTAYYDDKKRLVTSRRAILSRYFRSWAWADLVSATPICTLQCLLSTPHRLIVVPTMWMLVGLALRGSHIYSIHRCLFGPGVERYVRGKTFFTWLVHSRYVHFVSIAKLIWLVIMVVHYLACIHHGFVDQSTPEKAMIAGRIANTYFSDFFYAICLLQGQGDGTQTDNIAANLFSILTVLLGSVLLAIVFSNVAMLVSNFNANETNYQRKLEGVVATMDKLHLPEPLRRRIHQYYTHLWSEYESLDGDIFHFSRELSHTLALEVGLCRYMNLITTISFWKDCSPDFITQIVLSLVVRVYLPHDYVIRKGEIGTELFMINRGICELDLLEAATSLGQSSPRRRSREAPPAADGRSYAQIRKLRHRNSHGGMEMYPGEVLGEMSLLMNYRRTANVLALTHVEMCILTRESFQVLITRYADDRRVVLQRMIQSCIERKCIPIPWQDMCVSTGVDVRELSPSAATAILVDRLDRNVVDETIKYGFQASDTLPSHENVSRGVDPAPPPHSNDAGALTQVLRQQAELANKVDALADILRKLTPLSTKTEDGQLKTDQLPLPKSNEPPKDALPLTTQQ